MSYKFLEHPSDIIVLAKNQTFEAALEDVANGMFTQMGAENAKEKESFDLDFSAPTQDQLVVQLLTEIIAECETRPLTPKRMEVLSCRLPVSSPESRVSSPGHWKQDTEHRTRDTVSGSQFSVSRSAISSSP